MSARVAVLKWRRCVHLLCQFFRERGALASIIILEDCPWLIAAPEIILEQFEQVAAELTTAGSPAVAEVTQARDVCPQDVRDFFRGKASTFVRCSLAEAPFPGLRESVHSVVGVLRYCISDLSRDAVSASNMDG